MGLFLVGKQVGTKGEGEREERKELVSWEERIRKGKAGGYSRKKEKERRGKGAWCNPKVLFVISLLPFIFFLIL